MEREQLREHLDQLSGEIEKISASGEEKAHLTGLIESLERQLNEEMVAELEPANLVEQVESMVSSFERDHPTISAILNNIMVTLSSMGV